MALLTTIAHGRRWCLQRYFALLLGLALICPFETQAAEPAAISDEYQIKAVFLFNHAQFVEWPAAAFASKEAPIVIGILGNDPFGAYLDDLVSGEKIGERPLLVRRYKRVEDISDCHILFISRSEAGVLDKIIAHLKGRSVLTISDLDTFTRQGGMVRFATENGKIRLRINVEAAKACGLTISSKIIRPSTVVTAGKD